MLNGRKRWIGNAVWCDVIVVYARDTQDGQVDPISVTDNGTEDLSLGSRALKAHHYEIKGRYSQDIWYDERGRLVQVKLIGSDGSVISYEPI